MLVGRCVNIKTEYKNSFKKVVFFEKYALLLLFQMQLSVVMVGNTAVFSFGNIKTVSVYKLSTGVLSEKTCFKCTTGLFPNQL